MECLLTLKELKLSPRNYCSSFILLLQVLPIHSIAIRLRSVVACRNDVIHQSFNLREGVDSFKVVELKKSGKIIYIILF